MGCKQSSHDVTTELPGRFTTEYAAFVEKHHKGSTEVVFKTPASILESTPDARESATAFTVPDIPAMQSAWLQKKSQIAAIIGDVVNSDEKATIAKKFINSNVGTVDELFFKAAQIAPEFKAFAQNLSSSVPGTRFTCGENDMFLTKSNSSLTRKVESRMKNSEQDLAYVCSRIGDSVRETFVVEEPVHIKELIDSLQLTLAKHAPGSLLVIENKFAPGVQYKTGYVGVHMDLLFNSKNTEAGSLIIELQLHLASIFDGTDECPKEYNHCIYDVERVLPNTSEYEQETSVMNAAQMMAFHFGMCKALTTRDLRPKKRNKAAGDDASAAAALKARLQQGTTTNTSALCQEDEPTYHVKGGVVYRARLSDHHGQIEVLTKSGAWKVVEKSGTGESADAYNLESAHHYHINPGF